MNIFHLTTSFWAKNQMFILWTEGVDNLFTHLRGTCPCVGTKCALPERAPLTCMASVSHLVLRHSNATLVSGSARLGYYMSPDGQT